MSWNFGDLFEAVADTVDGGHTALIHEDHALSWQSLERRANNLAHALLARGLEPGDKVAFYLRNHPAYLETLVACFKSRLVHVNVNYRFEQAELEYILENSDSRAVVFDTAYRPLVDILRERLPQVRAWIEIDATDTNLLDYNQLASEGSGERLAITRSPEDLLLIYTGGTTGMPKGVMWTHSALLEAQFNSLSHLEGKPPPQDLGEILERVRTRGQHNRQLPAAPMMHATAAVVAIGAIMGGGSVVTLGDHGRGFEPERLLEAIETHQVTTLTIVGDSFARPLLKVLDAKPGRFTLPSLQGIISSGVIWSSAVKQRLLEHLPQVMLLDNFGSTEAPACGTAIMTRDSRIEPSFRVGDNCRVFTPDGREVKPGSGEAGLIARAGPLPLGYYKDPEKTARTFRTIDGVRYALPGDYCTVSADGSLTLIGRGSQCINTGGEKVFVEEVEEALKGLPDVDDALVFGAASEKWGQTVVGAVSATQAGTAFDSEALRQALRGRLAGYKIPKHIHQVDQIPRLPNGKADYGALKRELGDRSDSTA